jgi:hypothetical protein
VHQYAIPSNLRVNSDQTQVIYQQNSTLTYEQKGSQQVSTVGHDEKRAFTLNVAVSASGNLLPFQAIFKGKTTASLPSPNSPCYRKSKELSFVFDVSRTDTYWANIETMKSFVKTILVPYFQAEKTQLSLDPLQECIWQLDIWPVHTSLEFHTWIYDNYPWIILDYIPGGCAGLWQPCDVGIQCTLKLAVKHLQQTAAVKEVYFQLANGTEPSDVRIDTRLGALRDCVPSTLVHAFKAMNMPNRVQKVRSRLKIHLD